MTKRRGLYWLPEDDSWRARTKSIIGMGASAWAEAISLANCRLDLAKTNALDNLTRSEHSDEPPAGLTNEVRLAILGSSTTTHLHSSIRVGGLRRGVWMRTYEPAYGQYYQELTDPNSSLHKFKPSVTLFSFDARHLTKGLTADLTSNEATDEINYSLDQIRRVWNLARRAFGGAIIQQTSIDVFPDTLGQAEHRLAGSRSHAIGIINTKLREMADSEGVDLVSLDRQASRDGLDYWHDAGLWHRTKQEISPTAAPLYGDLVARVVAAQRGLSKKCLVLDLDNTIWGGVVGDDGISGIVLGQGSGEGEAFAAFQAFALELSRRGVILAISSKNDEKNAWEPFDSHPEMVLRRGNIACFQANWRDKATNIDEISRSLNIGLDSIVFVDDNPFERSLVRAKLPMVTVPEFPEDPAELPRLLSEAGFFEGLSVTSEDRLRSEQYQLNTVRENLRSSASDINTYLESLEMRLTSKRFDEVNIQRIVQLINKTNQFNLTTTRYTNEAVLALTSDPDAFGIQLRLTDRFGDNGIISILIGRLRPDKVLEIDTWLMSCRVLGRGVESAALQILVEAASALGARRIVGKYIPSPKNSMVELHYSNLGFDRVECSDASCTLWKLDLEAYEPLPLQMQLLKE